MSIDAHEAYLRALYYSGQATEQGYSQAIEYLKRALEEAPDYALAHAAMAGCYACLASFDASPSHLYMPKIQAFAEHALAIDDRLALAYVPLASTRTDRQALERDLKRSLILDPHYAEAHQASSFFFIATGQFDKALEEAARFRELDPRSPLANAIPGLVYYFGRKYDAAAQHLSACVNLAPSLLLAHVWLALVYAETPSRAQAIDILEQLCRLTADDPRVLGFLGYVYACAERMSEARSILGRLEQIGTTRYVSPVNYAVIRSGLQEHDDALRWLKRAVDERSMGLAFLAVDPKFDILRSDPRFSDLLRLLPV